MKVLLIILTQFIVFALSQLYLTENLLKPIITISNDYWVSFESNEINNVKSNIMKRFETENYPSIPSYIAYAFSAFELTDDSDNNKFKHLTWNFLIDRKEAQLTHLYLELNRDNSNVTFNGKFISSITSIPILYKEHENCYRTNRRYRFFGPKRRRCEKSISVRSPTTDEVQLISTVLTNNIKNYIRSISYQTTENNKSHSEL